MKLTKAQHKMLIESVATECAEEWPIDEGFAHVEGYWTKLMFQQGYSMDEYRFDIFMSLVVTIRDAQQLDRDPGGHLWGLGEDNTEAAREYWKGYYEDMIGKLIDDLA